MLFLGYNYFVNTLNFTKRIMAHFVDVNWDIFEGDNNRGVGNHFSALCLFPV